MTVPAAFVDSSGGGHDGTPIDMVDGSSVLTCQPGQADGGKALVQQGASGLAPKIQLPAGAWAQLQTFTVEFILKPTNLVNNQAWMFQEELGTHGWTIHYASGTLTLGMTGSPGGNVSIAGAIPSSHFTDGLFHQYVCGFRANPNLFEFHRDGALIFSTGTGGNHTMSYPGGCRIGLLGDVAGFGMNVFHGTADEVAMLPGLLSTARVAAHWAALGAGVGFVAAVMADSPVGYWRFEECGEQTIGSWAWIGLV